VDFERKFLEEFYHDAVSGGVLHLGTMIFATLAIFMRWVREPLSLEGLGTLSVAAGSLIFAALLLKLWLWNRELLVKHWQVCKWAPPHAPLYNVLTQAQSKIGL
jgi:hypothetical protein